MTKLGRNYLEEFTMNLMLRLWFVHRLKGILLCIILLTLFTSLQGFGGSADTAFQKEIATYELWTVVINFSDVSNPRCQVKGIAMSADMNYSGPVTIWKEQRKDKIIPMAEVGLAKSPDPGDVIPLKEGSGIHTLMIKSMSTKGTRRDSFPYMALFNVGNGMVEKMAETDFAIVTLIDLHGNNHDLLISLKGLKQAWGHCDPKK